MLTLISDLGMQFPTEASKTKRRMAKVLCSGCDNTHAIQMGQFKAGYTEYCKSCADKSKKGQI